MNKYPIIKQSETGAGLVEYTPITLFCSCILFSLFQVLVQGDVNYLWVIGGVVAFVVVYVLGFMAYDNLRNDRKTKS